MSTSSMPCTCCAPSQWQNRLERKKSYYEICLPLRGTNNIETPSSRHQKSSSPGSEHISLLVCSLPPIYEPYSCIYVSFSPTKRDRRLGHYLRVDITESNTVTLGSAHTFIVGDILADWKDSLRWIGTKDALPLQM